MTAVGVLLAGVGAVLASLPKLGAGEAPSVIVARLAHIRRAEAFALWALWFGIMVVRLKPE